MGKRISARTRRHRVVEALNKYGKSYRGAVRKSNFSSTGNTRTKYAPALKRNLEMFSNIEYGVYLRAMISPSIVDIRENYPLDQEMTKMIAGELGIRHPFIFETKENAVMTVDFLLTQKTHGDLRFIAVNCKGSYLMEDKRTLDKITIEREYFKRKGIRWMLFTERDLDQTVTNNLRLLSDLKNPTTEELALLRLYKEGLKESGKTVKDFSREFEQDYPGPHDGGCYWYRQLIRLGEIGFDYKKSFRSQIEREADYAKGSGLPEFFK